MNRYFKLCLLIFLSSVKSKIQGVADKGKFYVTQTFTQFIDVHLYESDELKCPSSGKVLTPEMINDNRCDCPDDGFDEPGTAACEKGRFYCKNVEKLGTYIPSFKVNDGVCDCCDGSDEYLDNFGIKCENACDALQSAHRRNALLERIKIKKVPLELTFFLSPIRPENIMKKANWRRRRSKRNLRKNWQKLIRD